MFDPDPVLVQRAAAFLGLTLDPAHLPGVAANLALLREHTARIAAAGRPEEPEPAPVFHP